MTMAMGLLTAPTLIAGLIMMGMDTLPPCGNDCDDTNPNINPGKPEVCGDGIDNDCDGLIDCADPDCGIDNDGDGHFAPVWK